MRILREPKNSLIGQYRKLLAYHQAELEFTDGALREIARIAHERGTGARGLRAVVEAVLEPVLFDPEPWVTYRVTEECGAGRADREVSTSSACRRHPWSRRTRPHRCVTDWGGSRPGDREGRGRGLRPSRARP